LSSEAVPDTILQIGYRTKPPAMLKVTAISATTANAGIAVIGEVDAGDGAQHE
jgi:hypothetical protein